MDKPSSFSLKIYSDQFDGSFSSGCVAGRAVAQRDVLVRAREEELTACMYGRS